MIEIIFTVIENSIMIWFLNQVFELKREKKLVYKDSIICVIILTILNIYAIQIFRSETLPAEIIAIVIMCSYLYRNMDGTILKKIWYSVLNMMVVMMVAVAFSAVLGYFVGDIGEYSSAEMSIIRLSGLILTKLCCLSVYTGIIYINRRGKGIYHLKKREWGVLVFLNGILYVLISLSNIFVWKNNNRNQHIAVLGILSIMLLLNFFIVILFKWLDEKNFELWKYSVLSDQYGKLKEDTANENNLLLRKIANLACEDVVALGRAPYTNWIGRMQETDRDIVARSLRLVGMEAFARKTMDRMSDGECQRILIARALAQDTPVILLDEPTAFLDLPNRYELATLLRRLAHDEGKCILFSTHDLDVALGLCDAQMLNNWIKRFELAGIKGLHTRLG